MERRNFLSSQIFFKAHYYSRIYAKHFQRFPIFWKFGNLSVLFLTNLPPKGSEKYNVIYWDIVHGKGQLAVISDF